MRTKFFIFIIALMLGAQTIYAQSGTCGDNLSWNLEDHVLTISGVGDMTNYNNTDNWAPWESYIIDTVLINEGVTSIGEYAFYREYLMGVTIPNSVTTIGAYAFCGCGGITSITLHNSVTSVGEKAFSALWEITAFRIPESVTYIGPGVIWACSKVVTLEVDENNPVYYSESNALIERNTKKLIQATKTTVIPNDIAIIGEEAFVGVENHGHLVIPESVISIEDYAFKYSSFTGTLNLPEHLEHIGKYAFYFCSFTGALYIPDDVYYIGEWAFTNTLFS